MPAPLLATQPATVFLDFSPGPGAVFNLETTNANISGNYFKSTLGLTSEQTSQVLTSLANIYNGFNVQFTTARPVAGDYHTIYVGGSLNELTSTFSATLALGLPQSVAGISQSINLANSNPNATGVVFGGSYSGAGGLERLAQVIAHETGHLFGLQHVVPSTELMYPFASPIAKGISSTSVPLGKISGA
jgi:hypothetical protein